LHVELEALAAQLGVADKVVFTGRVSTVTPYFHLADIVLLPSQHEGFGVPASEAMAAGTPVITSTSGALPWVLGADSPDAIPAGLLFGEGNVDELAAQITRILDDPTLCSVLIARGRSRVANFSQEHFATNVMAVIEEAMKLAQQDPPPAYSLTAPPLAAYADVALRDYRVRSGAPVIGRLIEWVRVNTTTHLKEAYLDRILERQVDYNRLLAVEMAVLQNEANGLRAQVDELRRQLEAISCTPTEAINEIDSKHQHTSF
jgi:hypothetical protein